MGVAKQQSDLKRSFSQMYQIDLNIFVDCSERSERAEKDCSQSKVYTLQSSLKLLIYDRNI